MSLPWAEGMRRGSNFVIFLLKTWIPDEIKIMWIFKITLTCNLEITSLEIRTSDPCLVLFAIHLFILCHLPVLGIVVGARTQGILTHLCPGAPSHTMRNGELRVPRCHLCVPSSPQTLFQADSSHNSINSWFCP